MNSGSSIASLAVQNYILSKLEHAYTHGSDGITVKELLDQDLHLSEYTSEKLQNELNTLEHERLVTSEVIAGRGEVYRLLIFETFDDLCRAKTSSICP